jgi:GNAT superfamily N-acetyltransferase
MHLPFLLTADVGAGTCRGVTGSLRGQGIGNLMVRWAIDASRRRGCTLMQPTTHKPRIAARRFYRRLGFEAGHEA